MAAMETKKTAVLEQWREFRSGSSIRGLKRTMTSPTAPLRLFWTAFLLLSLGLMMAQVINVFYVYFKQKDSTIIRTVIELDSPLPFPAVSLCRKMPYKSEEELTEVMNYYNATVTTPESYNLMVRKELHKYMENNSYSDETTRNVFFMMSLWDTTVGYHAQIPAAAIKKIVLPISSSIILTTALLRNGTNKLLVLNPSTLTPFSSRSLQVGFIDPNVKVKDFFHPKYLVCQTFHLDISDYDLQEVQSLEMLIWNPDGNVTESPFSRAAPLEAFASGKGMVLALHSRDSYGASAIDSSGTLLMAGGLTSVHFSSSITNYLSCAEQQIQHGSLGSFTFSNHHCRFLQRESDFQKFCNCTLDPLAWSLQQCLFMQLDNVEEQAGKYFSCLHKVDPDYDQCSLPPCSAIEFPLSVSQSQWRINDFQWKWFWEICGNLEEGMREYISSALLPAENRSSSINDPVLKFEEIKAGLVSVKIQRHSLTTTVNTEVALTSLGKLLSNLGGAFSLYMGITLTLMAELCEFFILLRRRLSQRTTASVAAETELQEK